MGKTIWTDKTSDNRNVHFESKLAQVNLIIRCCNCGQKFKGNRSFQHELRAARALAKAHVESHKGGIN